MEKLEKLVRLCKGEVSITVNGHRSGYLTVEQEFEYGGCRSKRDDVDDDVFREMVRLDRIVCVHFYPRTPVGFHVIYHYDIEAAVDEALSIAMQWEGE